MKFVALPSAFEGEWFVRDDDNFDGKRLCTCYSRHDAGFIARRLNTYAAMLQVVQSLVWNYPDLGELLPSKKAAELIEQARASLAETWKGGDVD